MTSHAVFFSPDVYAIYEVSICTHLLSWILCLHSLALTSSLCMYVRRYLDPQIYTQIHNHYDSMIALLLLLDPSVEYINII